MKLLIDVLLGLAVTTGWLGCVGFLRLRDPLDRLHCVTLCNVVIGFMLTAVSFVSDGVTDRSLKVLAIWLISIVWGAATSHASGRALLARRDKA